MQSITKGIVRSLDTGRFLGREALAAMGSVGGVLVVWDKRSLELLDKEMGSFSFSCKYRNVENSFVWVFSSVYGPLTRDGKSLLWEELSTIRGLWEDPWCIGEGLQCYPLPFGAKQTGKIDSFNEAILRF